MNLLENVNLDFKHLIKTYCEDTLIFHEDDILLEVGVVLEGSVLIKSSTMDGFEYDIAKIGKGFTFGDALVSRENPILPGSIIARKNSRIMFIEKDEFQNLLLSNKIFLSNYLVMQSIRNIRQQYRIKLLSQPSIREKILFFIKDEIRKQKSKRIKLSINREEMAQMMSLNRPSLSRELKRMKEDGIIEYDKWTITYLK